VPRENEKDPPRTSRDAIKRTMKLRFVDSMDEVLKIGVGAGAGGAADARAPFQRSGSKPRRRL